MNRFKLARGDSVRDRLDCLPSRDGAARPIYGYIIEYTLIRVGPLRIRSGHSMLLAVRGAAAGWGVGACTA